MSAAIGRIVTSLRVPNYRRYFTGQVVSISGNWMQIVAEMWLIVQLTGSGAAVGITAGLQFLPVLLFGAWGGMLADRLDKRTLLTLTQISMALPAAALWGLTAGGGIETWMVYGLVLARGCVTAVDSPARQAFVMEMVGPERVVNAVALNSVIVISEERRSVGSAARVTSPESSSRLTSRVTAGRWMRSPAASSLAVSGPARSIVARAVV